MKLHYSLEQERVTGKPAIFAHERHSDDRDFLPFNQSGVKIPIVTFSVAPKENPAQEEFPPAIKDMIVANFFDLLCHAPARHKNVLSETGTTIFYTPFNEGVVLKTKDVAPGSGVSVPTLIITVNHTDSVSDIGQYVRKQVDSEFMKKLCDAVCSAPASPQPAGGFRLGM